MFIRKSNPFYFPLQTPEETQISVKTNETNMKKKKPVWQVHSFPQWLHRVFKAVDPEVHLRITRTTQRPSVPSLLLTHAYTQDATRGLCKPTLWNLWV